MIFRKEDIVKAVKKSSGKFGGDYLYVIGLPDGSIKTVENGGEVYEKQEMPEGPHIILYYCLNRKRELYFNEIAAKSDGQIEYILGIKDVEHTF